MAIPADVMRVSVIGRLAQGEIFNTSFWMRDGVPSSNADANTTATTIAGLFATTALGASQQRISPLCSYDEIRVYSYPTGGPPADWIGSAPIAGGTGTGSATAHLPLQIAGVLSLRSGQAGRRSRGRMYLPINAVELTNHQLPLTDAQALCDAWGAFFSAINANMASEVCIVSQVGAGDTVAVSSLIFDTRLDTQRRRAQGQAILAADTAVVTS